MKLDKSWSRKNHLDATSRSNILPRPGDLENGRKKIKNQNFFNFFFSSGVDPRLIQGLPKVAWDVFKAIKMTVRLKNGRKIIKNQIFFKIFFSSPDLIQRYPGRFWLGEFIFLSPRALETIDFKPPRPPAQRYLHIDPY